MKKIILAASGGGHLEQIKQLNALEDEYDLIYLVAKSKVNKNWAGAKFVPEYHTETKIKKYFELIGIFCVSLILLIRTHPYAVISTGAAATFPICFLQKKLFKKKVIYIESFAKKTSGTKTGMQVYKFADSFVIQWEELRNVYPNAIYGGQIY